MSNLAEELLEALERHSQIMQANTAAVYSLRAELAPAAVEHPRVAHTREQLARQLLQAEELIKGLEQLRRALTPQSEEGV